MGRKTENSAVTAVARKKIILGVDPGTWTGWAQLLIRPLGPVLLTYGVLDFSTKKTEGGGIQAMRMTEGFEDLLRRTLMPDETGLVPSVVVAFEEIRFHGMNAGVDAAHVYGAVVSRLMEQCERMSVPYTGINPASARKLAWGKGNLKKPQVRKLVEEQYVRGRLPSDKNHGLDIADAVTVALALKAKMEW